MGFFNFNDSDLSIIEKLQRRKRMLNLRFLVGAYLGYLAFSLFNMPEEETTVSDPVRILVSLAFAGITVFIIIITLKEKKRIEKRIEEEEEKERERKEIENAKNAEEDAEEYDDDEEDYDYDDEDKK